MAAENAPAMTTPREVQGYIRAATLSPGKDVGALCYHHRWCRLSKGGFTLYKSNKMDPSAAVAIVCLLGAQIDYQAGSEFKIILPDDTEYLLSSSSERSALEWVSFLTKNMCYASVFPQAFRDLLAEEPALKCVSAEDLLASDHLIDAYVDKMRTGMNIVSRSYLLKSYPSCFVGSEAVTWFLANVPGLHCRQDGVDFGQSLMDRRVLHHVCFSEPFRDGDFYYRFQADEKPDVLNMMKIWTRDARNANDVAEDLRRTMLSMYGEHLNDEGELEMERMKGTQEFKDFILSVSEVQRVDLLDLTKDGLVAFFINLYNILVIHGLASLGIPTTAWARSKFYSNTKYLVGGHVYSLNDIEHGILRGNSKPPGALFRLFKDGDPRCVYCVQPMDYRIHFALNCGAKSCPPIKIYKAETLARDLDRAARSFCGSEVEVNVTEVELSMLFHWYSKDFGATKSEMLATIATFVGDDKRALLEDLIKSGNFSISFRPYDWSSICSSM